MEQKNREGTSTSAWIDWTNRIVSFEKAAGFEELRFPTHGEMFQFVIAKGHSGFRIQ